MGNQLSQIDVTALCKEATPEDKTAEIKPVRHDLVPGKAKDSASVSTAPGSAQPSPKTEKAEKKEKPRLPLKEAEKPKKAASKEVDVLSLDFVVTDLDQAEQVHYSSIFQGFAKGGSTVGLDDVKMRKFVAENSMTTTDDIDTELLRRDLFDSIDQATFLKLLRELAANESDCIESWITISDGVDSIPAPECRTGIALFIQEKLPGKTLTDNAADRIITQAMTAAGAEVNFEQWSLAINSACRMVRLVRQIRDEKQWAKH